MREMVEKYNTVLVIGGEGEKCRQVAEGYGFRDGKQFLASTRATHPVKNTNYPQLSRQVISSKTTRIPLHSGD